MDFDPADYKMQENKNPSARAVKIQKRTSSLVWLKELCDEHRLVFRPPLYAHADGVFNPKIVTTHLDWKTRINALHVADTYLAVSVSGAPSSQETVLNVGLVVKWVLEQVPECGNPNIIDVRVQALTAG